MAHQGRFICSEHNKWPSRLAYSYDQHKQVVSIVNVYAFFHICQTMPY
jgi:hypothetical protein